MTRRSTRWMAAAAVAGCLTAVIAVPAADADEAVPARGSSAVEARPASGLLDQIIPPGARQLLAGIRIIDAWNGRNRVYREARGVQHDLRAHYGALMSTAERLAEESGDPERYARVQQMLAEERDVAISLTEDEKRDAKYGFESRLRRELTTALLQVPKVREGLAALRGSLDEIRSAVDGVRTAVAGGDPLAVVISQANDRLARLKELAAYGQVIGGRPGRQLASLTRRLEQLVDQASAPTDGTVRAIDEVLARIDSVTADVDDQLTKGRWIRTGAAVRQVRDVALEEAIGQLEGVINGSGPDASAFVNALSNAIVRERAARDDLPPLSESELRSMRDRVQAAIEGRSLERVGELCGRLAGEVLRTGRTDGAVPACSIYGDAEMLQQVLDGNRTSTTTTVSGDPPSPGPQPTAAPAPATSPPAATTTQAPLPPRVIASVPVGETVTGGTVEALSIVVEVDADLATGVVNISSTGGGGESVTYPCDDGTTVIDELVLRQTATAVGTGNGEVARGGGAFSASFEITGSTRFEIEQPYDDPACTQFNSDYPTESPYTGSGSITGTVSATGQVTVETSWSAGGAQVTGAGSGADEVLAGG